MLGRPIISIRIGQGPIVHAIGAAGGCLDIFILVYPFSPLSPSLWETARYRLKYCLKGPLNPKQPTKPTNHTLPKLGNIILFNERFSNVQQIFRPRIISSAVFVHTLPKLGNIILLNVRFSNVQQIFRPRIISSAVFEENVEVLS